jgi:hypothetical protein
MARMNARMNADQEMKVGSIGSDNLFGLDPRPSALFSAPSAFPFGRFSDAH